MRSIESEITASIYTGKHRGDVSGEFACDFGVVHNVEVYAVGAAREQIGYLVGSIRDARFHKRIGFVVETRYHTRYFVGYFRARKTDYSVDVVLFHERHNARLYGHVYACGAYFIDETVKIFVVEEKLRNEMSNAAVHFHFEVFYVLSGRRTFGMTFGIACRRDVETESAGANVFNKI